MCLNNAFLCYHVCSLVPSIFNSLALFDLRLQSVGKDGRTNVTGAGDTMVGTALWWLNNPSNGSIGSSLLSAIYGGTLTAAVAVLEVDAAVKVGSWFAYIYVLAWILRICYFLICYIFSLHNTCLFIFWSLCLNTFTFSIFSSGSTFAVSTGSLWIH